MKVQKRACRAIVASGTLVLVALVGSRFVNWLWLALLPATVLFALGTPRLRHGQNPAAVRIAALLASSISLVLVALALAGMLLQRSLGMEPAWLTRSVTGSSWLFVLGVAAYGLVGAVTRSLPRGAAVILALSLPLGFGLDAAMTLAPGFFLHGAGYYLGVGLFALSLVRIGVGAGRQESLGGGTRRPDGRGGVNRLLLVHQAGWNLPRFENLVRIWSVSHKYWAVRSTKVGSDQKNFSQL